ncbi:MAG: hypothetical protein IJA72_01990 [Clostridia bacterium]|nr:hypothetical protein [Clostridia bacterium]
MKKIYILEHFDFSEEQMKRLKSLGDVIYFEKANQQEIDEAIKNADAILLDWLDPNPILAEMKEGQFICLPYTGYDWVKNISMAKEKGVVISNTPNYSTNAVAEHHLALILDCAKHITSFNNTYKSGKEVCFNRGLELKDKKVGIIGLGNIGKRLAELLSIFGVEIVAYNRTPKNLPDIKDVDLSTLLSTCDIICNTCKLTPQTRNMIGLKELKQMKSNAILTSTTGGIINLDELNGFLKEKKLFGVGLDDVDQQQVPEELLKRDNIICTYHRAYDTNESENNRIDLCINSIEEFFKGNPINLI